MRSTPRLVLPLALAVTVLAVGCSSGSTGGARAASTTAVTTSTTTPKTIPGTLLEGDFAFLGPIYTVRVGGLTMAFRRFGSGPDLLLIAGQASPMSVWPASTLAALAKTHRVTIYDNRDLGNTTDTAKAFTLADLADDAAGLIAALGLRRPAVFGWSTGGEIGLLLAVRHPDVLSALAITGATPGGPRSMLPPPDIVKLFADPNPDVNKLLDVLFSPAGVDAENGFLADFVKVPQAALTPHAAEEYDAAEKDHWAEPEPNLDAITVPVLVMNGADDYAVPSVNATYIAERIGKKTRLELTPAVATAGSSSTPPTSRRSSRTSSVERRSSRSPRGLRRTQRREPAGPLARRAERPGLAATGPGYGLGDIDQLVAFAQQVPRLGHAHR